MDNYWNSMADKITVALEGWNVEPIFNDKASAV